MLRYIKIILILIIYLFYLLNSLVKYIIIGKFQRISFVNLANVIYDIIINFIIIIIIIIYYNIIIIIIDVMIIFINYR